MAASEDGNAAIAKTISKNPWLIGLLLVGGGAGVGGWANNWQASSSYLKEFEEGVKQTQSDVKEIQKTVSEIKTGIELLRKDNDHLRDNTMKQKDVIELIKTYVKPEALR